MKYSIQRGNKMGIYNPDAIGAALNAVILATEGVLEHVPDNPDALAYRAGFRHAITATAAAFGLIVIEGRAEWAANHAGGPRFLQDEQAR